MIKLSLVILLSLFLTTTIYAQESKIYVWKDKSGALVFTDSPISGAKEVEKGDSNVVLLNSSIKTEALDIKPEKSIENYQVIINTPTNNATIRDNTGSVYLSGSIKPKFLSGLKVQLMLDGKEYKEPQGHSIFSLKNIDRGEHNVKMLLMNQKGKVIASSELITFYMHRASINN